MDPQVVISVVSNVGTKYHKGSVKNVYDIQHTPYKGETGSDASVKPAQNQSVNQYLNN
jgi:hypothetical protein